MADDVTSCCGELDGVSTPIGFTLDPRGATEDDRLKLIVGTDFELSAFAAYEPTL